MMSLLTGQVIHRYSWTKLPASADVIKQVKCIAEEQGQGLIGRNFKYTYSKGGDDIDFDDDVSITNAEDILSPPLDADTADILATEATPPVIHLDEGADTIDDDTQHRQEQETHQHEPNQARQDSTQEPPRTATTQEPQEHTEHSDTDTDDDQEDAGTDDDSDSASNTEDIGDNTGGNTHNMELRTRRPIDYRAFHTKGVRQLAQRVKTIKSKVKKKFKVKVRDIFRRVMKITMSHIASASKYDQVSVEGGIKRYGNKAIEAVLSEYSQLNDKNVFRPRLASELT